MSKRYQIGVGKNAWFWKSNIVQSKITLPLKLEEIKNHCFKTKKRIFCLQNLDEYIKPPHKVGDVIFFTEKEAQDILKKLKTLLKAVEEKE